MPCQSNQPKYTEFTVSGVVPTSYWGLGNGLEYTPMNAEDFTQITPSGGNATWTVIEGREGSAPQISPLFDAVGAIEATNPEFFGDCYVFSDKVDKLNNRLTSLKLTQTSSQSPVNGRFVNAVPELPDFSATLATGEFLQVRENVRGFVQPNGFINTAIVGAVDDGLGTLTTSVSLELKFMHDPIEDANPRFFRYAGKKQPSYVKVTGVSYPMLPSITNNTDTANSGKSLYQYGESYGKRFIGVDFVIIADNENDLRSKVYEFADFLHTGNEEEIKFIDDPERFWRVRVDGNTDIASKLQVGRGTINFLCMETTAVGEFNEVTNDVGGDNPITVTYENTGTAESFPIMTLKFERDADFIDIVGAEGSGNITLGSNKIVTGGTPFNPNPNVAYWWFNNNEVWTQMTDFPQGMEKQPFYKTTGIAIPNMGQASMKGWHYGIKTTDSEWRGSGISNMLSRSLTDFRVEANVAAMGKIHADISNFINIILLDQNGKHFARGQFGARWHRNILDGYMASTATESAQFPTTIADVKWRDFQGKVIIERIANKWRMTIGSFKTRFYYPYPESNFGYGTSMLKDVMSTPWMDLPRDTWDKKLGGVGVVFQNYNQRVRLPHLSVRRLTVWEHLQPPETGNIQIIKFKAGDELVIDFPNGQVWLNGNLTPSLVDPSTDWFALQKGFNVLGFNNFEGKVTTTWNNRYK